MFESGILDCRITGHLARQPEQNHYQLVAQGQPLAGNGRIAFFLRAAQRVIEERTKLLHLFPFIPEFKRFLLPVLRGQGKGLFDQRIDDVPALFKRRAMRLGNRSAAKQINEAAPAFEEEIIQGMQTGIGQTVAVRHQFGVAPRQSTVAILDHGKAKGDRDEQSHHCRQERSQGYLRPVVFYY